MTLPSSGYATFNGTINRYQGSLGGRQIIEVPADKVIMISFPKFDHFKSVCPGLRLYTHSPSGSERTLWRECDHCLPTAYVFSVKNITIKMPDAKNIFCRNTSCVELLFSFHSHRNPPKQLPGGLFNCSGDTYNRFQKHVECNMKVECVDGRDERDNCPDRSYHCHGMWVVSHRKCFTVIAMDTHYSAGLRKDVHTKGAEYCSSLNGSLGGPLSEHELHHPIPALTKHVCFQRYFVPGLYISDVDAPDLYKDNVLTSDRAVIHHSIKFSYLRVGERLYLKNFYHSRNKLCLTLYQTTLQVEPCKTETIERPYAICEFAARKTGLINIEVPSGTFPYNRQRQKLTKCPDDEVVHMFLSCFPHNVCGEDDVSACNLHHTDGATTTPSFTCEDGVTQVSYTLLCDFRHDCPDFTDEIFCRHPHCDAFACSNGQCVSLNRQCDMVKDCTDSSDEQQCEVYRSSRQGPPGDIPSPVLIDFEPTLRYLSAVAMNSSEPCPDTHYRCPGEFNDCLPVYTRCNGWYDCVGHEDEEGCDNITCPGYYRCFTSDICVHADHLCDGWPHCPKHDDEWLCNVTCPSGCICHGLAFLCSSHSSLHHYPQIRYLNAQDSKITPSHFAMNSYLVYLNLANCSLINLPAIFFSNLKFLDLSRNFIEVVNISIFAGLENLQTVSFSKNPLSHIHGDRDSSVQQTTLKKIDLSYTKLKVFTSKTFSNFFNLQILNLSYTDIHTILPDGFRFTPLLTHLYMKESPVKTFPEDLYRDFIHIHYISAQTFKLCCKDLLPDNSKEIVCHANRNELSSCKDLLQNEMYRACLWIISVLSVLGNAFCFVVRVCLQTKVTQSGFHLFVTNLSISDLLMGIYIAIVGTADEVFRGKYAHYDVLWTSSLACKIAGFLSLLSSEVSALTVLLITLDRFIVLRFPFGSFRFERRSASVVCATVWLLGLFIALLPLLPTMSHWKFYSQTGICIPLPVTRREFKGRMYSFSILIVFNFVVFLLIASGQAFIYWSVQKNALTSHTTKVSRDLTLARRLISVAVTDFLCWFPIGVCGLLASSGTPIAGEVNVTLAIFVLPINSAINPFMYTFNMLAEKRRKSNEAKLLKWLESHTDLVVN